MNPPCQSVTEAFHTATLLIYIYICVIYPVCVFIREMNPPGQLITEALHTATLLIYRYIYICLSG